TPRRLFQRTRLRMPLVHSTTHALGPLATTMPCMISQPRAPESHHVLTILPTGHLSKAFTVNCLLPWLAVLEERPDRDDVVRSNRPRARLQSWSEAPSTPFVVSLPWCFFQAAVRAEPRHRRPRAIVVIDEAGPDRRSLVAVADAKDRLLAGIRRH